MTTTMTEVEALRHDMYNSDLGCYVRIDDRIFRENEHCLRFENTNRCHTIITELNNQRHTGDFLDLVVKVQDKEFPCHRAVLASTPYFKAMLSSNLSEGNSKVVQLHGVDSDGFSKILDFLYTEIRITQDDVHDILQAAHMLQIDKITEYCQTFIEEHCEPSNCLHAMRLSDVYGFSRIRAKARALALSRFSEMCQNEEFLTLSGDELLDLLTDEKLRVTDEEVFAAAVIQWLDHYPENCRAVIVAILQEIRLMSVRVSTLKKLELHPVIQDSPECLAIVKTAEEKHFAITHAVADEWKPRLGTSDVLAILVGGWRIDDDKTGLNIRDWGTPSYHVTNLPTPVTGYMSVTSAERCLYVTGGRAHPLIGEQGPHSAPSRQAFRYDFLTDTWTALPDMPRGRAGHQSAIVDEKLFLVGGDTDDTPELSMDCYDLEVEAWMKPPALPELDPSSDLTVTACGSKLVLVELLYNIEEEGRYVYRQFRPELRIHWFEVKTANWLYDHTFPRCSSERLYQLVTVVHDKVHIFLVGGSSVSREIVVYDVEKGTLFETEETKGLTFCGTRYVDMCVDEDNYMVQREDVIYSNFDANNQSTPGFKWDRVLTLPLAMIGHSILVTKKSAIGWYCRDLDKLDHDEEDEAANASLGRAVTCIPID